MSVFLRTEYNYDMHAASLESAVDCQVVRGDGEPVKRVQEHFQEECDINTIVKRFGLTGQLPENVRMPQYVDVEEALSFQDAMNVIVSARESFDAMPAEIRARFANDPMRFADFCTKDENYEEAKKFGLVKAKDLAAAAAGLPGPAAAAGAAGSTGSPAAAGGPQLKP